MKGDKKILAVAILLLLISVGFTTYAIYKSSASITGSASLADWHVEVDGTDITTTSTTLNFDLTDVTWTVHNGKNDTLAPGDSGYIEIGVDATGSEVDVLLTAELGTVANLPTGMTVTLADGADSQTIEYGADGTNMTATVRLNITWATEDSTERNPLDVAARNRDLTIPITLVASQAHYTAATATN